MNKSENKRIESIDLLRGVVMFLMALDHVRDFFHYDSFIYNPTDLSQTTSAVFFTRFITNFCAPVFCFLAGTSAFLVGSKKDKNSVSMWLLKRGFWLIFVEFTIMHIGWYFKFNANFIDFSVIWCLGVSMIFLAGLIHLPKSVTLFFAFFAVFGHNLFDTFRPTPDDFLSKLWYVFHVDGEFKIGNLTVYTAYPLLPWIGLMALGYYFGGLYLPSFEKGKRAKFLYSAGFSLLILVGLFRISNFYGDLRVWEQQPTWEYTLLSVLNLTKYPPSFSFICITIAPALLFLAMTENVKNRLTNVLVVVGQVPMFFYIIHIYFIHLLAVGAVMATGRPFSDMVLNAWIPSCTHLKGYGFSLPVVYLIWLGICIALYPVCKKYNLYKKENKEKWWLSYL